MTKPYKLSLTSREHRVDPWTACTELRERGPVVPIKSLLFGKGWAATSYEAVSEVLKDDKRFVRDPANAGRKTLGRIQYVLPRSFMTLANNMIARDGVDHRRLRGFVDQAFARRNIEAMADRLETLAVEQINECREIANRNKGGGNGSGEADLVNDFAKPFPFLVICELLGLPKDCRNDVHQWLRPISEFSGPFDLFRMISGIKKMKAFLIDQFEAAKAEPREGLISELLAGQHEEGDLTEEELLATVFMLFVAGHETTVHLITHCILTLRQFPDAKEALLADWSKCDAVIEEVLRYSSPIQFAKPRYVAQDTTLSDVSLKRGQLIFPMIACANYDPARFTDPQTFDIQRQSNHHLTFGSGPHTCLGIKLARSETTAALKALYTQWPDFEPMFSTDLRKVDWSKRPGMRGIRTLKVR